MAEREEVAQRDLDRRCVLTVPVAAQDRVTVVPQVAQDEREVEVGDATRTVDVQERERLACRDGDVVAVRSGSIPRRRPLAAGPRVEQPRPQRMTFERPHTIPLNPLRVVHPTGAGEFDHMLPPGAPR